MASSARCIADEDGRWSFRIEASTKRFCHRRVTVNRVLDPELAGGSDPAPWSVGPTHTFPARFAGADEHWDRPEFLPALVILTGWRMV
jgi:hypothetical protein